MHLSYGKYAREGNVKETGNGKKLLKGIKNMKQKRPERCPRTSGAVFSSELYRIVCEERASTVLNVWKDSGEPMCSSRRKGGQLGTASLVWVCTPQKCLRMFSFHIGGDTKAKVTEGVAGNLTIANRKGLEAENYKWGKPERMSNCICKCLPSLNEALVYYETLTQWCWDISVSC